MWIILLFMFCVCHTFLSFHCFFCGSFMLFLSFFLCFHARVFIDALWSPAGKGWSLGSRLWCLVTFPLVSWLRCDAWLYWFRIFTLFLTLIGPCISEQILSNLQSDKRKLGWEIKLCRLPIVTVISNKYYDLVFICYLKSTFSRGFPKRYIQKHF